MKTVKIIMNGLLFLIIVVFATPTWTVALDEKPQKTEKFKKEELVQMLAPIALYPDSLTADILMASTYPLEIVEAERWLRKNGDLKGEKLDDALREKDWDPSVKSLCHFPDILYALSEKLDQTVNLGDAFLAQQDEVMATIQELRHKAKDQGNLETTKEHKVVVEREIIRIEPAEPGIIYVPVYDPLYVYGPWWYPAYRPYYWYYPPGFVYGSAIIFPPGFYFRVSFFSWCWFDWHRHHIYYDVVQLRRFHIIDRRFISGYYWRHDPSHRRGIAYRDRRSRDTYGTRQPAGISSRRTDDGRYRTRGPEGRTIPDGHDRINRERSRDRSVESPADRRNFEKRGGQQERRATPMPERRTGDRGDTGLQERKQGDVKSRQPEPRIKDIREGEGGRR